MIKLTLVGIAIYIGVLVYFAGWGLPAIYKYFEGLTDHQLLAKIASLLVCLLITNFFWGSNNK